MSRGFAGTRPQGRSPEGGRKPLDMSEDRPSPGGRGSGPKRSGAPDPLPAGEAGVNAPTGGERGKAPWGRQDKQARSARLVIAAQPPLQRRPQGRTMLAGGQCISAPFRHLRDFLAMGCRGVPGRTDLAKPSRKCALRDFRTAIAAPQLRASRARSAQTTSPCPCRLR